VKGKINQLKKYYFDINGQNLIDILGNDSFLVVPLYTKKEPLGIIIADNKFTRRDIQEDDISALRFFASQASMAIENAMLYDRLEDRIHELQDAYKQLETSSDRLVKAERLAAIGKMAASVAHEIRNPLVSVGGFARLLEKRLPGNEELHNYAAIITQQVENLEYILNNILSIASPRKPRYSSFDIHTVLHQLLNFMDDILQKKEVKVLLHFQCKESLVLGDEKMIFQAILNIFKNALEALGDRRTLSLKTDCDKKYVRIDLHDSGRGISRENLTKIYDPFFTTKTEGTGLGLTVVRQIIEDHHGKIEIYSKERQGTTVKIFLPRSLRSPKIRKYLVRKLKSR
jgi:signal transduction histidine kinase